MSWITKLYFPFLFDQLSVESGVCSFQRRGVSLRALLYNHRGCVHFTPHPLSTSTNLMVCLMHTLDFKMQVCFDCWPDLGPVMLKLQSVQISTLPTSPNGDLHSKCVSYKPPYPLALFTQHLTVLVGLTFSTGSFISYDSGLYMSDETLYPTSAVPAAMVKAVLLVGITGWAAIVALLFAIQHPGKLLDPNAELGGENPLAQLLFDVCKVRLGTGNAAAPFLSLTAAAFILSSLIGSTGTSRKLYAMGRQVL